MPDVLIVLCASDRSQVGPAVIKAFPVDVIGLKYVGMAEPEDLAMHCNMSSPTVEDLEATRVTICPELPSIGRKSLVVLLIHEGVGANAVVATTKRNSARAH